MTTTIDAIEQTQFGEPLHPIDRVVAGIVLLVGAAGHAALVAAGVTLFYVLLLGL